MHAGEARRALGSSVGGGSPGWRVIACLVGLRLRAAVRERQYLAALVLAAGVVGVARGLRGWVHETERWTLTVDLGFAALLVAGVVLALAVTVTAWFADVVDGWGRGVLATAVELRRWWVAHGIAAAMLALGLCLVVALAIVMASEGAELTAPRGWRGALALGLWWVKLATMSVVTLAIASRSRSPSTAMIIGAGALLVGHLHPLITVLAQADGWVGVFWRVWAAGLPDLTAFEVSAEWIAWGERQGPGPVRLLGEGGVLAVWLTVAFWSAGRRG